MHMRLVGFSHVNIRCTERELPAVVNFYREVLGLRNGHRPDFGFAGAWLYCGEAPLVHISARYQEGLLVYGEGHRGSVDHVAFEVTDVEGFREHLQRLGIKFREATVPGTAHQIFVHDPVGTKLELSFRNQT